MTLDLPLPPLPQKETCPNCLRLMRCVLALLDHAFDKTVREQAEALVEELTP